MATYLNIDGDRLEVIAADFAGTEKQIDAACRRAVSKLVRHLKVVVLRNLSMLTGVQQSVLRNRIFVNTQNSRNIAVMWIGTYSVPLRKMNPKQTRTGVSAGGVDRAHAWIFKINGNPKEVYKRTSKAKYPILKQQVDLKTAVNLVLQADVMKAFDRKFYTYFEREMKWESNK
ncbi:hypothetical protein [Maridesulfovibrio salexigens]|uniref:Prophage minor tail protein Z (GPZ) n=1 Tax=Maridesulfovibrio salexigens (strain ATCC 14822 / DSM 2638 / NCIMB 8403 / VKM B-1763) TaxID=526222 RepID=C6BVY2_MARSD|nr:hypothetical protein [Maridesulfovibrio salexigens]ACS80185.1 conserved hypothetical protein [Maridesulfovibrio salexigens DSM 2638]